MTNINPQAQAVVLDPGASDQVRAYRLHQMLTSPPLLSSLVVTTAASALLAGLAALMPERAALAAGWSLITGAVAGTLALLFTYATTYRAVAHRRTIAAARALAEPNLFAAASFATIAGLAPAADARSPSEGATSLLRLLDDATTRGLLARLQLSPDAVAEVLDSEVLPRLEWSHLGQLVWLLAERVNATSVEPELVVGALLAHPAAQRFLRQRDLNADDVATVVWWLAAKRRTEAARSRWWDTDNLVSFTGVGLSWTAGYTPLVDQFARFPKPSTWNRSVLGHEDSLEQLIRALARERQSNVLIVGAPGVGRRNLVRELAKRVVTNRAHPALNGLRVLYLHLGEVLAQAASMAGQRGVVNRILDEMERAGNIIAVFDGLGSVTGGQGAADLTDVLLPFLGSLTVRVVVIAARDEYHRAIRTNQELSRYFTVIDVPPLTPELTLQTMLVALPTIESATGVFLPYRTLRAVVRSTTSLLPQVPYPERAFDVLEEAIVAAQQAGSRTLTPADIHALISQKVGVPLGTVHGEERERLLQLEALMHRRLVDQEAAVAALARAMLRARMGVRNPHRPIGVFLFLGPTGVGKTEAAKTLAEAYFGSEERLSRLDMGQYQTDQAVAALIGGPGQPTGRLTSLLTDRPYTVLLLDEFEKAHPTVRQLFLPIFDEGFLTDNEGTEYSFQHTIIIATSNAGAEFIRETVKDGHVPPDFSATVQEYVLRQGIFTPELVNRFDGVITFAPLSHEHVRQVAALMLDKLNRRLDAQHGITVAVTPALIDYLVQRGYSPEFGARPMARAIQNTVEYAVAQMLLKGEATAGQHVVLPPELLPASAR